MPSQLDRDAAARGLKMNGLSVLDLDDLIAEFDPMPTFAAKVIVEAAKQVRAVKLFNGARR